MTTKSRHSMIGRLADEYRIRRAEGHLPVYDETNKPPKTLICLIRAATGCSEVTALKAIVLGPESLRPTTREKLRSVMERLGEWTPPFPSSSERLLIAQLAGVHPASVLRTYQRKAVRATVASRVVKAAARLGTQVPDPVIAP